MSFKLTHREPIPEGIRRIWHEELQAAIYDLERSENPHETVHQCRKTFKRLRAVLRLVRFALGKKAYKRENRFYRDLGRKLSGMRDAQVMLEALDTLRQALGEAQADEPLEPFRQYLLDHLRACEGEFFEETNLLENVSDELRHGRKRIDRLSLGKPKFASIRPGLQRIYQQGHEAFRIAKREPTDEHLHQWRKRVKYLWHQIELLHLAWVPVLDAYAAELHRLSDLLGADHDLCVLEEFLREGGLAGGPMLTTELEGIFIAERALLRNELFPLGKKIYQEKPKHFARRIETYYQAWTQGPLPRVGDEAVVLES